MVFDNSAFNIAEAGDSVDAHYQGERLRRLRRARVDQALRIRGVVAIAAVGLSIFGISCCSPSWAETQDVATRLSNNDQQTGKEVTAHSSPSGSSFLDISSDRYSCYPALGRFISRLHPALPSDADEKTAKEFFKLGTTRQLNLAELCQDKTVCLIGEAHDSVGAKTYLASNVSALAQKGYTLIAFEAFQQKNQKILDEYMLGKVSKADFIQVCFLEADFSIIGPEGYLKILDAMKSYNGLTGAHLRAIALEGDIHHSDDYRETMSQRNNASAKKIDEVLQANPGGKIAAYVGSAHLGVNHDDFDSLNQELAKLGRDCVAISLDYELSDPRLSENRPLVGAKAARESIAAAKAARESGVKSYSSYPIELGEGAKRADYGVYIPFLEPPPGQNIGRDVTAPSERGMCRTGLLELPDIDTDGQLLVTTENSGKVIKACYKSGKKSEEMILPKGHESKYHSPEWHGSSEFAQWCNFHEEGKSGPERLVLYRNDFLVEILIGADGKVFRIIEMLPEVSSPAASSGKDRLLFPSFK